jgi:hypothetical protein
MSVLASLYVAFLVYIGWSSLRGSAVTSVGWPVLVAAFFWPPVALALGRAGAPLFIVIGAWTLFTVWRDYRPSVLKAKMPSDVPAEQQNFAYAVSVLLCAIIVIPVLLLGAAVAARALAPAV